MGAVGGVAQPMPLTEHLHSSRCHCAACATILLQDIRPWWDSILKTLDYNVGLSRFAGPDRGWNDLDMLSGEPGGGRGLIPLCSSSTNPICPCAALLPSASSTHPPYHPSWSRPAQWATTRG